MADALNEDYRERGVIPIHVMIEDCPDSDPDCTFDKECDVSLTQCYSDADCPGGETCIPNSVVDWKDAHQWAYEYDTSGDDIVDPFQTKFPVLADVNGVLWNRFSPGCTGCSSGTEELACQLLGGCQVTTQTQVLDRGLLTVDDTCHHDPYGTTCTYCVGGGYDDAHIRSVLNSIVPAEWCGEATE